MPGVGEKPRWVIIDDTGKTVNNEPTEDELKGLKRFPKEKYKRRGNRNKKYTDEELLSCLTQFFVENGRLPTEADFNCGDDRYSCSNTFINRFGSWSNALKLVGLDVESMIKKGVLETANQKGRFAEIIIRDHFDKHSIDLAEENCRNPYDGICPNNKIYDVKSSKFNEEWGHWQFGTKNKYKDDIEIYYLLAFNKDYTELMYAWRIPGEVVEKDTFYVGLSHNYEFDIKYMEEYDITYKIREVLGKYEFLNKCKKKEVKVAYNPQLYDGYITAE